MQQYPYDVAGGDAHMFALLHAVITGDAPTLPQRQVAFASVA
jgi:hypothetical protein